jgi:hypothetical protein
MKQIIRIQNNFVIIVCAALMAVPIAARADDQAVSKTVGSTETHTDDSAATGSSASSETSASPDQQQIVIQTVEDVHPVKPPKVVAWLGLAVEESPEALSSQLGLRRGEGLTVDYMAAGSPAAKADFHKNDVLVELDGQMLVHPIQFRKLVQMHSEGDTIKLTFFRSGKKQTLEVKLGKINWDEASNKTDPAAGADLENLQSQLTGLTGELRGMSETLSRARLDKARMDVDMTRTMEQTRKAIQDAMRRTTTLRKHTDDNDADLDRLAGDGVDVDKDATIILRNKRNSNRTVLQTDDTGTYIIEEGAKVHLTARNKFGKSLFDGDIGTPAERQKVPKEVWEKVQPMFDQLTAPDGAKSDKEGKKSGE